MILAYDIRPEATLLMGLSWDELKRPTCIQFKLTCQGLH